MILATFIRRIQGLRDRTEILEALNWDEELTDNFVNELQAMLMAAPPNLEKAIFWLKNTPWECFDNASIPENVFHVVEILITRTRDQLIREQAAKDRRDALTVDSTGDDYGWN